MITFRSPLERRWSRLFTNYGWEWSYSYTKGTPPQFWLTLPTNGEGKVYVTVSHTDVRLSDRFEMLKGQVARIRDKGVVPDVTPILAVSSRPFVNREFEIPSEYLAVWNWYCPNCIGFIDHYTKEIGGEYNHVYGPTMIRKLSLNSHVLYWIDERANWQYSELKYESKPKGYYSVMVDNIPWPINPSDNTIRLYDIGKRKPNPHLSSLIDDYLWKPPRGLMVRKMMKDVEELAKADGIWVSPGENQIRE